MVIAMMARPPDDAFLEARRRADREHELHRAARAERAMREVAVVTDRAREELEDVNAGAEHERGSRDARPHRGEARDVERGEHNDPRDRESLGRFVHPRGPHLPSTMRAALGQNDDAYSRVV